MQHWWFDDVLGLKSVCLLCCFMMFTYFNVLINIHEYANEIICISGHGMKGICLTFNLIPSLVVYDMSQLRYD